MDVECHGLRRVVESLRLNPGALSFSHELTLDLSVGTFFFQAKHIYTDIL